MKDTWWIRIRGYNIWPEVARGVLVGCVCADRCYVIESVYARVFHVALVFRFVNINIIYRNWLEFGEEVLWDSKIFGERKDGKNYGRGGTERVCLCNSVNI